MRRIHFIIFGALLLSLAVCACKKELSFKPEGTSSFTIVNGLSGTDYLFTNFNGDKSNGQYYANTAAMRYGNFLFFNSYTGQQDLGLYSATDTNANSKPVLRLRFNLERNAVYTLFLSGTTQDADYLMTNDQLPYHLPADSTMGLRFINLAKGSAPITVNLVGKAFGSEEIGLPYKGVSAFKNYNANSAIRSYTFEFRDKASGTLLGSCLVDGINNDGSVGSPNIRRNRNYTIVLLGSTVDQTGKRVMIIDEAVKI
ncbi:DUF4397 domain-containing protein [Pedobacter sp. MC2016-24]|uniref:DUF4397 domain-containing protein n=1 Tax=Pedobacter sp. MC2016-24 TaxID=2780090 RepID=UPI001881ED65|nr:DUF4397 domain-containing protein [Pedobacter sp. MC2016-24]MBE9601396.1 DUF4397 domain-containing protein [Pedobacter sp. MC2016-24]